ncbi:tRNA pseudouridine(38-40) synthase TruA [Halobacteriovorax sp. GB3]|uniref:tRNA pseudouridine(38-40) synthase TruA n=1 Tax=Halobacteriovorax sp. GB3 TaxID=2719615 RepID=UPI00235ED8D2|nr:tRNA pseudouridine(38-40) synthase TruA [Halobacteriovorax sp. GB3]MDD0852403.1 tRNA pseudouridine(38-40) synthase TruA [Halobacteriovorax sp. GB3]
MNFYKAVISYKGTRYQGWQIQPGDELKTVQGSLNKALSKISKSSNVRTIGSGRTDSGVHAFGQVVRIEIPLDINEMGLLKGLNSNLSDDIRVLSLEKSSEDFHPVFHAKEKEYHYRFTCKEIHSPFTKDLMTTYPYELDFDEMNKACKAFVGKHDFADFRCVGTDIDNTVREIFDCRIEKIIESSWQSRFNDEYYVLIVRGSGFLKQMVRLIMGTIWSVGKGRTQVEQISKALKNPTGNKLGVVAPAEGLYLIKVDY